MTILHFSPMTIIGFWTNSTPNRDLDLELHPRATQPLALRWHLGAPSLPPGDASVPGNLECCHAPARTPITPFHTSLSNFPPK